MEVFGLTPWEWALPLVIGITAGFMTNAIAIWMLFHPYKPVYLGPVRVMPMGAIPKEIDRIAKRIGETVGRELLTSEDIARTLGSSAFRDRFDEALRDALQSILNREMGPLREMVTPAQVKGLERTLDRLLDKLVQALEIYFQSPDWEDRVRSFTASLTGEFRDRPLSVLLTPELQADLAGAAREIWVSVRESPEFARVIAEAVDRAVDGILVSEKPLRHYVPAGAVNLGEAVVAQYLPLLLERLGQALDHPDTRATLQQTLRRFVDRFLEEQQSWKRMIGRLVITERTLAQTVQAIEQGGVDEISALLREPEVQERVARAVNEGVEDLIDRPLNELLSSVTPQRAERLRALLVERILYLFRHPGTEDVVLRRLDGALGAAGNRSVGDVLGILGEERAGELTNKAGDWVIAALRGPRSIAFLHGIAAHQTSWMLSVPIGRPADYLPRDAVKRAEGLLFGPLWEFLQRRVPAAVGGLPVAEMVEEKLKSYPIAKVEELIWRVSKRELVLIIYLGGFLGAIIGSAMLFTASWQAGAAATLFFLSLSFGFINLKG
ncbi:hypothetical protein BH23GEM6_BH23GEM6_06490 [soil metagenome]